MSTMCGNPEVAPMQFTINVNVLTAVSAVSTAGSVPPEVATPSNVSTPPEVATLSEVDVPPEVTPKSTVTVPLEVSVAPTESVPSKETVESTENTSLEVTSESTESVPPELTVESTESAPPEETSEPTGSVPMEATILSLTSDPPESIVESESDPSELTSDFESTDGIFLGATTLLLEATRLLPQLIVQSKESAPSEVTSESIESVPPKLSTVKPTESAPSEVTTKPTKVVPPEVTNLSEASAPLKVTIASSENIPPESTAMSSVSVLPPGLTATARVQSAPPDLTKARDDAINLHRAFKGLGCDATTIVKILAHQSATQRALIRQEYKKKFSEDLDNRLSKELYLSLDLKRAVLLWMDDPATRDAKLVKQGLSENLKIAIEVICSRTPSQIERLKKAYHPMFDSFLEKDIESHASGDNKKLLLAYVGTARSEGPEVDANQVEKDANALFRDGEYKLGTNEETFIRIFSERSWAHLAALNSKYGSTYVNSLKKAVKKETSFKFKSALLTIIQCAENPGKYFAKILKKAMKGLGTDEQTLTRIIVSRAEVDIQQIKAEYLKKYGKSLSDEVHSETSGNYRSFLISLLDTNN